MSQGLRPSLGWLVVVVTVIALAGCMMPNVLPPSPVPPAPAETVTLQVGPMQVDCTGVGPQKCLLIRESADLPYQYFYFPIEGFTFEEGYNYELKVEKTPVANPPADAPSFQYKLVEVVSKTPAGEISTIYVAPMTAECETTQIYQCLLVADSPDGEYRPFYGKIQGFSYEPGFQYALLVEKVAMDQPPADAPAGVWNLLAITQKVAAAPPVAAGTPLEGTLWVLDGLAGAEGKVIPVLAGTEITATFLEGRVAGSAGCNNYTADYTLDGSKLTIGAAATTRMACETPAGISEQESAYLAALAAVASYKIDGETLTLSGADGGALLTYTARPPTPLVGVTWIVTNYNNGQQAVVGVLEGTELTLTFDANGTVSGSAGCNNFSGGYSVDGNAIKLGPLASTMKMCVEPDKIMVQEAAYLAALQTAATVEIQGDRLELRTADGALAVSAAAQVQAPTTESASSLEGTLWTLASYADATGDLVEPVPGAEVTASFQDGKISGNAGCNNYMAEYKVDGSSMTIGVAITTMMMCQPEAVAQQEQAYLAALSTVASYKIEGETLILSNADGKPVLTYAMTKPASLIGTDWQVGFYNNGKEALVSPLAGTKLTILLGDDGQISGKAGCNTYSGPFAVDSEKIQIGPLATTRMMCAEPAGIMEQESAFLAALQSSATFSIQGDELDLLDAQGVRAVTAFSQAPVAAAGGSAADVVGKSWVWQGTKYGNDTEIQSDEPGAYTLELTSDGQALVRASCNSLAGKYTLSEDGTLAVELPTDGLSDCGEASPADEYLRDLNSAAVFSLSEGNLFVDLFADAGTMQFALAGAAPAVAATAAPAEATPAPAATGSLIGPVWAWQSLNLSDGAVTSVQDPSRYTVQFMPDGTLQVQADCNKGGGAYSDDNGALTIEVAALTRMACPADSLADTFVAQLNSASSYTIDQGSLNLTLTDGVMVLGELAAGQRPAEPAPTPAPATVEPTPTAVAPAPAAPSPLVGPIWQWIGAQSAGDRFTIEEPARYTIKFLPDGKYELRADCNTGGGSYAVDGNKLAIQPAALTLMACADGSRGAEFAAALTGATRFAVVGGNLYIVTSDGSLLKLQPAK